jgi:hypothetical protein
MAKDYCVICGKETLYDVETHIDYRIGYVEGAGQLCSSCWDAGNDRSGLVVPRHVVRNTPNDAELGSKVRQIYNTSDDREDNS